jgi:hypothetical protein
VAQVELAEAPERVRRTMRKPHGVHELRLGGDRGFLGVMTQPLSGSLGEFFGAENGGALVSDVVDESPAAKLGLQAGDVITSIDGTPITNPEDLRSVVRDYEEETEIEVAWLRDKKEKKGTTTLEVRESPFGRVPHLGFLHDFDFHHDFDHDGVRRHVVEVFGDEDVKGSLEKALDEVKRELEALREEVDELKNAD